MPAVPAGERAVTVHHWRRWPSGLVNKQRILDGGLLAWALIGFLLLLWVAAGVVSRLSLVLVPLVIALFPAALLAPASQFLKRRGFRPAMAAGLILGGFLVAFGGLLVAVGWLIADELGGVTDAVEDGYAEIQDFAADRFDAELPPIDELLQQFEDWALGEEGPVGDTGAVTGAATATLEVVASTLLGLVALFFYLKDGGRIAAWFVALFPPRLRDDATEISARIWTTLGAYFRGQLAVAAVDALFIGAGLFLLDVPLAFPLSVLVFLGGLFPVVGAFAAGALAVLIALADQGPVIALAVLGINLVVQQLEGDLLAPLIVGRATQLHPLAVLVALTAGGAAFGILGAFLAVPVVASLNAGVRYVVHKDMARPPHPEEVQQAPGDRVVQDPGPEDVVDPELTPLPLNGEDPAR